MKNIMLILFFTFLFSVRIFAQNENQALQQAQEYDFSGLESIIDKNAFEYGLDFDFDMILNNELNSKSDFGIKTILNNVLRVFFNELYKQSALMRNIFIICVLSGIFKSFTDSFKTKEISELGFYVCYIAVVALLINSFCIGLGILKEIVLFIAELARAGAPALTAVMLTCGEISAGGMFSPLIITAMSIATDFISDFFIPGIKISAVISIVNYLSNKEMLERLSRFLSGGLNLLLKTGAFVFMGIISLQKIGTSAADNAVSKTLQAGINSVPVIGDVFSGAAQSIMSWSSVLKTGVGISVVTACIVICMVPIMKIIFLMLLYKVTAILIEPFCDKRITSCIDTIGGYMLMILSAAVTVLIMFVFAVIIVISAIGG